MRMRRRRRNRDRGDVAAGGDDRGCADFISDLEIRRRKKSGRGEVEEKDEEDERIK